MAKVLQTLRTHWKKSIFFSGLFVYGVNYGHQKYEEKELMRQYSRLAVEYGKQTIPLSTVKPYHVTVILNPASHSGKARNRFEKYCFPLLNLAGFKVSLIRTEGQGDAKDLMSVMSDTDAVLVAGEEN